MKSKEPHGKELIYDRVVLSPGRFVAVSELHKDCNGKDCLHVIIQRRGRKGEPRNVRLQFNLTPKAIASLIACAIPKLNDAMERIKEKANVADDAPR